MWDYYDRMASEALSRHHYAKASRIVKDALYHAWREKTLQPKLLRHADELARVYRECGDYDNAASLYRLIIESQRLALGDRHPDVESASRELVAALMESGYMNPGNA